MRDLHQAIVPASRLDEHIFNPCLCIPMLPGRRLGQLLTPMASSIMTPFWSHHPPSRLRLPNKHHHHVPRAIWSTVFSAWPLGRLQSARRHRHRQRHLFPAGPTSSTSRGRPLGHTNTTSFQIIVIRIRRWCSTALPASHLGAGFNGVPVSSQPPHGGCSSPTVISTPPAAALPRRTKRSQRHAFDTCGHTNTASFSTHRKSGTA